MNAKFRCTRCHCHSKNPFAQRCEECGGILEVCHPASPADRILAWTPNDSMWRYASSMLVDLRAVRMSLGEGGTPLIEAPQMATRLGIEQLLLKLELVNPTGSFKDRALSAAATHARHHGAAGLVGSSSGNALHAQAAYAALAELSSLALVPVTVSADRLVQPTRCGTRVVRVQGDYSDCHRLARAAASLSGWYNVSTTYENPVGFDAYKTMAYELWEACEDTIDWIVIPVGAGPLLGAMAQGYADIVAASRCPTAPALLGIQASSCAPIVRAFERGAPTVTPWDGDATSVAKGIADPLRGYAEDGTYTLAAVIGSGGAMVSVSEAEIQEATRSLARICGLHVDPAAAATIAGLEVATRRGIVSAGSSVIAIITGTGFKEVPADFSLAELGAVFDPDVDPIESILPQEVSHDTTSY